MNNIDKINNYKTQLDKQKKLVESAVTEIDGKLDGKFNNIATAIEKYSMEQLNAFTEEDFNKLFDDETNKNIEELFKGDVSANRSILEFKKELCDLIKTSTKSINDIELAQKEFEKAKEEFDEDMEKYQGELGNLTNNYRFSTIFEELERLEEEYKDDETKLKYVKLSKVAVGDAIECTFIKDKIKNKGIKAIYKDYKKNYTNSIVRFVKAIENDVRKYPNPTLLQSALDKKFGLDYELECEIFLFLTYKIVAKYKRIPSYYALLITYMLLHANILLSSEIESPDAMIMTANIQKVLDTIREELINAKIYK